MLRLFGRLKLIDWILIIFLVAAIVGQVYFDVTLPDYTASVMDILSVPNATGSQAWSAGWPMIPISLGSMGCTIVAVFFASLIATNISKYLRADMFKKVQSFGFDELNKFGTPSLITRSTNDIEQVQMAMLFVLRMGVSAPLTAIWAIVKVNARSPQFLVAIIAWVAFLIVAMIILVVVVLPKFGLIQKYTDKINQVARQNLTGLRVVKAYSAEKYEEEKFGKVARDSARLTAFVSRMSGLMMPLMFGILNGLMLTIYLLSANLINGSNVTIDAGGNAIFDGAVDNMGSIYAFLNLAMQVLFAFIMLLMLFIMVPRAIVSAKRINEVRYTVPMIQDPKDPKPFVPSGEIEFKNVSFKYHGAEACILNNLNFKINEGETVAFIGSTGSGKSTIINLVPRFHDVTEGEILIGGVNIKDVKQEELLKTIGYVPQKSMLFSGTVAENIGFGLTEQEIAAMMQKPKLDLDTEELPVATTPQLQFSEMEKVAMVASAHGFVSEMSGGYNAHIAQGGKNVSGGQRQRLSIARAVAIDPKIFIFDDSFSALDYKTDKAVRQSLKDRGKGTTNLIVAQRVGGIMDADKIIVLNEGQMIGIGTHKELMQSCDVYKEIALSQLSKEELGVA